MNTSHLMGLLVLLGLSPSGAEAASTPDAVLAAMGINAADVSNLSTAGSDPQVFDVRGNLGPITPPDGADMGLLYTGNVDNLPPAGYPPSDPSLYSPQADPSVGLQPGCGDWDTDLGDGGELGDAAVLSFDLLVPAGSNSLAFDSYFLTREWPEFVGLDFNDSYEVTITGTAWTGQIVFDNLGNPISVNSALFGVTTLSTDPLNPTWNTPANPLLGTGFDMDGGTGWLTTTAPVDPGDTIHLEFNVHDVSDGNCDSAVLLDFFRFLSADVTDPVTTGDDDDSALADDDDSAAPDDDDATPDDDDSAAPDDDDATPDDDDSAAPDDDDATPDDDDSAAPDDDDDATPDDDDATPDDDDSAQGDDDDSAPTPFLSGSGCPDCASQGGGRGGPMALLLLGGLLGLRRRRRKGALPPGAAFPAGLILALALLPSLASAQSAGPSLDVQRFDPVAQGRGFALVRDAAQPSSLEISSFLSVNYGLNPLQVSDPSGFQKVSPVIDHLIGFDLGVSFAPTKWLQLGIQLPFLQVEPLSPEARTNAVGLGHSGGVVGTGDTTVTASFGLLRQGDNAPLSLALAPRLVLPTGTGALFVGSDAYGFGGDLAVGARWKHFHFSVNIGFQANTQGRMLSNLQADDELRWGIALGVPLLDDQLEIQLEWVGATVIDPVALAGLGLAPFSPSETPAELHLSALIHPKTGPVWFQVGAGPGTGAGFGTPDVRIFGMFGVDVGCNCGEGKVVERIVEKIVEIPDPDPDRDGILGDDDQCPHVPEDKDGFEDEDGCPDLDNDEDTVFDVSDRCPMEPETLNGVDDLDGCPDEGLAQIDVKKQEIVILDKVYFDLNKDTIKRASHPVLDAVIQVMSAYPSIEQVEVQGHTDSRGDDAYNLDLSQRRADAVVRYITAHGIDASRLKAKGYGETMPLVPNATTDEEHSQNRRVQFVIKKAGADAPRIKQVDQATPTEQE